MKNNTPTFQPIETAPKDGTAVILYHPDWNVCPKAKWGVLYTNEFMEEKIEYGAWLFEDECLYVGTDQEEAGVLGWESDEMPTHWASLPETEFEYVGTDDGPVFIEKKHCGKSMTNSIERIMYEKCLTEIVYFSSSDKVWNKAVMGDGEVSFSTPEKGHACYDVRQEGEDE